MNWKGGYVSTNQTDQIGLETRVVGGLVILVLLAAVFVLYVFPDSTAQSFSWTIAPRLSAVMLGAGYAAGAYFFVRVILEKQWHRVQAGFLPITAFTVCMLAATVLHWGRFHQGTLPFYAWTTIYVITPFLVPYLWWRNRASASQAIEARDLRFSSPVRWLLGAVAVAGLLVSALILAVPSSLISIAPWKLTELTARVFAGWSVLTSVTVLTLAVDARWSATRILLESAMVGQVLMLLAMPRVWGDLNPSSPLTMLFWVSLGAALIVFAGLHLWLDRLGRSRAPATISAPPSDSARQSGPASPAP